MRKTVIFSFIFGAMSCALLFTCWKLFTKKQPELINQDYYLLSSQVKKLNKMVVLEQDYSNFQTHKSAALQIGGYDVLPKEMVLYATAKAQVSYDLSKMQIRVDSVQKKLILSYVPAPELKVFPDVKVYSLDDNIVNRFDKNSMNSILESAKKNITRSINQKQLEQKAHGQLLENLDHLFVLAKALHYKIEDQTGTIEKLDL